MNLRYIKMIIFTKDKQLEKIFEFIDKFSREIASQKLGTSVPTLQRWLSSRKFPDHVWLMVVLYSKNEDLEHKLDYANYKAIEVKQTVSNFVNASQGLKDLLSD